MNLNLITKTICARAMVNRGKRTPLRVIHRITTRCNLKCTYCDHQLHEEKKNELSTLEIKSAMKEFADCGTVAWGITGGEPFLRKDLSEIINFSRSLGFMTSCITNGTVASKELITEVSKDLHFLVTSLEGNEKNTDLVRGNGVYDKVLNTIEVARNNGLPVVIATMLSKDFLESDGIRFMGELCKKLNVRCSFQNILLTGPYGGDGFNDAKPYIVPHVPSKDAFFNALDLILKMRSEGYPFVNNKAWVNYIKSYMNGTLKPPSCYAGKLYCNFFEDGSLRTCQYHPIKIKESSIKESLKKLPGVFGECPCTAICYVNYNLAFSFNLPMILDGVKNILING